jgi:beta-glucosidase
MSVIFYTFLFSRFGTYSIDQAINAGLDLEMPGINKLRTSENVGRSIVANKLTVHTIKERAKNVLELLQKCAKGAPEVRDSISQLLGLVINLWL